MISTTDPTIDLQSQTENFVKNEQWHKIQVLSYKTNIALVTLHGQVAVTLFAYSHKDLRFGV